MELWTLQNASPRGIQHIARQNEEAGWDGLVVVDSQNLSGDCYVALAMAASATQRIGIGPGVTNSVTRTAAVTASAITSVQRLSKGRAVLGIGRGDSALAHIGRAPARLGQFETYLRHLQIYLGGGAVPFDEIDIPARVANPVADLKLSDTPQDSSIEWIDDQQKVPVEVAATGPKVIAIAARHADRIMFTLGANPDRISWGLETARKACDEAGLDPDDLLCGAYVNCACHTDQQQAREMVKGGLTTFARFSVMHGEVSGPLSPDQRRILSSLHDAYDMREHTRGDSPQAEVLTDEFIDRFAIAGPPEHCISRIRELQDLGLDKLIISGPVSGRRDGGLTLMESDVLPAISGS
jgi:5,10-methylenetetrahydromethanopterin reductase